MLTGHFLTGTPAAEPAAGSRANNHSSQALLSSRGQKCTHGHGVATCVLDIVFWLGQVLVLIVSVCTCLCVVCCPAVRHRFPELSLHVPCLHAHVVCALCFIAQVRVACCVLLGGLSFLCFLSLHGFFSLSTRLTNKHALPLALLMPLPQGILQAHPW